MSQQLTISENIADSTVIEKLEALDESINSLQKGTSINTQRLVELDAKLSKIIQILEHREAIRKHLGSSY